MQDLQHELTIHLRLYVLNAKPNWTRQEIGGLPNYTATRFSPTLQGYLAHDKLPPP